MSLKSLSFHLLLLVASLLSHYGQLFLPFPADVRGIFQLSIYGGITPEREWRLQEEGPQAKLKLFDTRWKFNRDFPILTSNGSVSDEVTLVRVMTSREEPK